MRRKQTILEKIMALLLDMEQRMATKDDIKRLEGQLEMKADKADLREYATKNDLDNAKEEILDVFRPLAKAVDKDAVTIIDHGKRIVVLEQGKKLAAG